MLTGDLDEVGQTRFSRSHAERSIIRFLAGRDRTGHRRRIGHGKIIRVGGEECQVRKLVDPQSMIRSALIVSSRRERRRREVVGQN